MREYRTLYGELRHRVDGDTGHLEGYAVKWNRYSQNLGGFVEQIAPGAAATTIAEKSQSKKNDIRGTYNHRTVLARQATGTLNVYEDEDGIGYEMSLNLRIGQARDVIEMVDTGLVTGSSFGFRAMPDGEEWGVTEQGFPLRTVTNMELYDLGPVDFPAYLDSEAAKRHMGQHLQSFLAAHDVPAVPQLRDCDTERAQTNFMVYLEEAQSRAEPEPEGSAAPAPRLAVARRRLELSRPSQGR